MSNPKYGFEGLSLDLLIPLPNLAQLSAASRDFTQKSPSHLFMSDLSEPRDPLKAKPKGKAFGVLVL